MQVPLEIRFHGLDRSEAVEARVREQADKLEKFYQGIVRCQVAIEAPHRHHQQGNLFNVKLRVTVPEGEVAVTRDAGADHRHEDAYVALNDAFRAARRQLQDYARARRGKVKHHDDQPTGRVALLDTDSGWGRITTRDRREIAFHRNSVVDAKFEELLPGTIVRFAETAGEDGPVASTVHIAGGHRAPG